MPKGDSVSPKFSSLLWLVCLAIVVGALILWKQSQGAEVSPPEARASSCSSCDARHARMVKQQTKKSELNNESSEQVAP